MQNVQVSNTVNVSTPLLIGVIGGSGTFNIVVSSLAGSYWAINGIDVWDASLSINGVGTSPSLPLLAAVPAGSSAAASITNADSQPIPAEAIARWATVGLSTLQLAVLKSTQVQVVNLGDPRELGHAQPGLIQIDDNAAGWDWYVEPTPHDDSEFGSSRSSAAAGKMDLLTQVMHELGHELGLDHDAGANSVMNESLLVGAAKERTYRMSRMIDELLEVSTSADDRASNSLIDSRAVLDEALDRLTPQLTQQQIQLTIARICRK